MVRRCIITIRRQEGGGAQLIKSGQMISDDREFFRDRRMNGIFKRCSGSEPDDVIRRVSPECRYDDERVHSGFAVE